MPDFIDVPITVDETSLQDDAFAYLQAKVDGYVLNPAHPMTWLVEAISRNAAEVAAIVAQMPSAAFRYLGQTVYGIEPDDGSPAIAVTTWTATDTLGHTIPAGTQILIDGKGFVTDVAVTISAGASSVSGVAVTAQEDGTDGNGLGAEAEPVDAFTWLDSITVVGTTSGGTDAESDDDYQDRLADELALQAPRPITADDYAKFARRVTEVDRALAIDNFANPHNLLTANQSSFESGTTGWVAGTDTTIAQSAAQADDGTKSLAVTKTVGAGAAIATIATGTSGLPVTPANKYYIAFKTRAAATGREVNGRYAWYDASGTLIGSVVDFVNGFGTGPFDTTTGWTQHAWVGLTPPSNAAFLSFGPRFENAALSEVHYIDKVQVTIVPPPNNDAASNWVIGDTPATDVGRHVAVVPIKSDGQPVSSGTKSALVDMFESLREVNFLVSILDPQYTTVNVVASVTAYASFDLATVDAAVEAAILSYLSPANWGTRPYTDERVWDQTTVVRYLEIAQVINSVDGVNYINSLTINGSATDLTLSGVAPIPSSSSTASVTVTY